MKTGRFSRILITIFLIAVAVGIGAAVYFYSGRYNMAATEPHLAITEQMLEIVVKNSVGRHAADVKPFEVGELSDTLAGFTPYNEMCVGCHGAPGIGRSEFGKGLYPLGPSLDGRDTIWTDTELFWIIKNGLKMTGMPAFGPTHSDEEIWRIVAFTKHMSELSYFDYLDMEDSLSADSHEH